MARILTTRVSCVHEQYHVRHLKIYCSFPTTSAKNRCWCAGCCSKLWCTIFCLWEGGEASNNSLARNQLEGEESEYITAIESDFRSSKMAAGSHLWTKSKKIKLIWNGEKCDRNSISVIQNGGGGVGASQWPVCKPFGDIHSICPWANTPILVLISGRV